MLSDALWHLGRWYRFQAQYDAALLSLHKALDVTKAVYGAEHANVAHVLRQVGRVTFDARICVVWKLFVLRANLLM